LWKPIQRGLDQPGSAADDASASATAAASAAAVVFEVLIEDIQKNRKFRADQPSIKT